MFWAIWAPSRRNSGNALQEFSLGFWASSRRSNKNQVQEISLKQLGRQTADITERHLQEFGLETFERQAAEIEKKKIDFIL